MKLNKFFLIGAIALGMVACKSEDVPTPNKEKGNTYVGLTIQFPTGGFSRSATRALPGDFNPAGTWKGRDNINTIKVYMVNTTDNTIDKSAFTKASFNEITAEGKLNPKLAVSATAGKNVKAYVVINGSSAIYNTLDAITDKVKFDEAFKAAQAATAADVANYGTTQAGKETIMMTNSVEPVEKEVLANVTEAQAIAGTSNQLQINVDRVVARAMVTVVAGPWKTADNKVDISKITYAVGQSNKKFYIMKKANYETPAPVYGYIPSASDWAANNTNFDYTGLTNYTEPQVGTGTTNEIVAPLLNSETTSKFVLPVTHEVTGTYNTSGYVSNYKKGNTTYFEVKAIFTPTTDAMASGQVYDKTKDVFYGVTDGKFYVTRAAAEAMGGASGDKNQQAITYKSDGTNGSIMKYVLWLNPNKVPGVLPAEKTTESPTVRNQVYHAYITGFKEIGVPNNPLNPNDPTTDPENPSNPIKPEDPLQSDKTYLSVKISVLDWGVHSYQINVGNNY